MPYVPVFFGILSIITLYYIGVLINSHQVGLWAGLLLALNGLEIFFARYSTSEIVGQCFFLCGLLFFLISAGRGPKFAGVLAALAWSLAILTRFDAVIFIVCGLFLLWLGKPFFSGYTFSTTFLKSLVIFFPIVFLYLHIFCNYQGIYLPYFQRSDHLRPLVGLYERFPDLAQYSIIMVFWILGIMFVVRLLAPQYQSASLRDFSPALSDSGLGHKLRQFKERSRRLPGILLRLAAVLVSLYVLYDYYVHQRCDLLLTGRWLGWYFGKGVVVLFILALYRLFIHDLMLNREEKILPLFAFLIPVGLIYLYKPHVEPFQIWAMRRFVSVFLPLVLVLALAALKNEIERIFAAGRARSLSFGIVVLFVALNFISYSRFIIGQPLERDVLPQLQQSVAKIPHRSIVLFERQMAGLHLHTSLKFTTGMDTLILQQDFSRLNAIHLFIRTMLSNGRPVIVVMRQSPDRIVPSGYKLTRVTQFSLTISKLERSILRRPTRVHTYDYPFALYRLIMK
ncbi:hypothetical protein ACFL27_21385 [candidate division CSSED10-310 bacterium]|uniref:Glycosyltransferase RgtA/B/C/D-like domain-containing protein n=1 Tax=candidate division CSSED10-310 bacterium TaxID=2855610 RepID=A0ABV6Z2T2_UNCC1